LCQILDDNPGMHVREPILKVVLRNFICYCTGYELHASFANMCPPTVLV